MTPKFMAPSTSYIRISAQQHAAQEIPWLNPESKSPEVISTQRMGYERHWPRQCLRQADLHRMSDRFPLHTQQDRWREALPG